MRAFLVLVCATLLAAQELADQPIIPLELGVNPSTSAIAEAMGVRVVVLDDDGRMAMETLAGPGLFTPTTARGLLAAAARRAGLQLVWVRDGAVAVLQPENDPTLVAAVEAGQRDPSPAVRLQAVWRAGFLHEARAVGWLLTARGDADPEVRSQARHSLSRQGLAVAAKLGGAAALPTLEAVLRETWALASSRVQEQENAELADLRAIAAPSPLPARAAPTPGAADRPYVHWPLRGDAIDQAWTEHLAARLLDSRPKDVRLGIAEALRRHPAIPARSRAVAWRAVTVGWSMVRSEFDRTSGRRRGRHSALPPPACALHLAIGQWEEALAVLWQATPDPILSQAVAEDDRPAAVQRLRPLLAAWGSGDPEAEGHGLAMLMLLGGAEAVDLLRPWWSGAEVQRQRMAAALLRSIDDGPARAQLAAQPPASPLPADLVEHLRSEPALEPLSDPNHGLTGEDSERLSALLRRYPAAVLREAFAAMQTQGERFALRKAALELEGVLPIDVRMEVLERAMLDSHVQLRAIAGVAYVALAGLPHAERVLALAADRHHAVRMHSVNFSNNMIEELAERLVVRAAGDRHPDVRRAVTQRMEDLDAERVRVLLLRRVQDAGDAGRDAVAALLVEAAVRAGRPPPPEETAALLAATASGADPDLRAIVTDVLRWSAWEGDAPGPALQRALDDAEPLVRGRATAVALLADAQRGAPLADRLIAAAEPRSLIGFLEAPGLRRSADGLAQSAARALLRALMAGEDRKLGERAQKVVDDQRIPVEDDLRASFRTWQQARERRSAPPTEAAPPGDF